VLVQLLRLPLPGSVVLGSTELHATLPSWAGVDNLRTTALVVLVASVVLFFLVMRFVQKLMLKFVMLGLLALVGFGAWYYRADLGDCAKTCACSIAGQDVKIPADKNPACSNATIGRLVGNTPTSTTAKSPATTAKAPATTKK
jgi:uncharacterized membrane protein (UPF0136 family)